MKFIHLGILLLVFAFCGMPVQWATTNAVAAVCVSDTPLANQNSSNEEKDLPKKKEDKDEKEEKEDDRNEEENKDKYSVLKSIYDGFNPFEFAQNFNAHYTRYEHYRIRKATPASPLYILYSNLKIYC